MSLNLRNDDSVKTINIDGLDKATDVKIVDGLGGGRKDIFKSIVLPMIKLGIICALIGACAFIYTNDSIVIGKVKGADLVLFDQISVIEKGKSKEDMYLLVKPGDTIYYGGDSGQFIYSPATSNTAKVKSVTGSKVCISVNSVYRDAYIPMTDIDYVLS